MAETEYAIRCEKIRKTFGSVVANDAIDLDVRYGEILALLGENGSGKTTLMNMISGIYHPDGGTIYVDGKAASIQSPLDAQNLGIGMIHQHFKLVNIFSAMENIELGTPGRKLPTKVLREKVMELCRTYGLETDPEKPVHAMSVSEKQTVEILKVLYRGARILILDEPTAVLTPQETEKLFAILRQMRKAGCAVIIITHKLNEVLSISDRVTILRKGKSYGTVKTAEVDVSKLTELMVGHAVTLEIDRPAPKDPEDILKLVDLTVRRRDGSIALDDVSFSIRTGEILGVAGIAGSGQKELCETIAGLLPPTQGAILYKKENLAAGMGMTDNMLLKTYTHGKGPMVDRAPARKMAEELVEKLDIVTAGIEAPVRMMSGGNVQKVLLGREIESNPDLLITAYPVRGLDINSSYLVYDLLNEQKEKGVAVVYIGEDLDVLLQLCDRIVVLCHGRVTGDVAAQSVSKEQIGLMMTGESAQEVLEYGS